MAIPMPIRTLLVHITIHLRVIIYLFFVYSGCLMIQYSVFWSMPLLVLKSSCIPLSTLWKAALFWTTHVAVFVKNDYYHGQPYANHTFTILLMWQLFFTKTCSLGLTQMHIQEGQFNSWLGHLKTMYFTSACSLEKTTFSFLLKLGDPVATVTLHLTPCFHIKHLHVSPSWDRLYILYIGLL